MSTLESHTSLRAIGEVLEAARVLGRDAWRSDNDMTQPNSSNLAADVLALFSLLHDRNVPYLLVGGVALLKYIDGRNTQDIDLVISVESLARLPEITITDQQKWFARGMFKSVRVDLLLTTNPLFEQVRTRFSTIHPFNEFNVPCATVEGLIILKFYALPALYLQGDSQRIAIYETDILMLLQRYRPGLEPMLEVVRPHVGATQFEELKKIAADIEQRLARMESAQRKSSAGGSESSG